MERFEQRNNKINCFQSLRTKLLLNTRKNVITYKKKKF